MASSFSTNLGIEKPATGELSGSWGDVTNFNFDIFGLYEGFQFTNYKAPSGKYNRHVDKGFGFPIRKLSISIQLTDPKEYEGGELYIDNGVESYVMMKKDQGALIAFPSYTLHEVMPVTKGERNSLVTWVTGKPFK